MQPSAFFGVAAAPVDAHGAYDTLARVSATMRERGDARAVFPDVYAIITRRVIEAIEGRGGPLFFSPPWLSRLAGRFATLYLEALRVPAERGRAWALAHERATARETLPSHDALLGINAHINIDLARGLRDNIVAHGASQDPWRIARYRHDHDAVNDILREAIPECLALLSSRYRCPLARLVRASGRAHRATCAAMLAILKRWRDLVWQDVLALLDARTDDDERRIFTRMEERAWQNARVIGAGTGAWWRLLRRLPAGG